MIDVAPRESVGASIVGANRTVNEDAWAEHPDRGVFVVADGCGGLSSGRIAADIAIDSLARVLSKPAPFTIEPLAIAIDEANAEVFKAAVGVQRGMGAAIALLRLTASWAITASIGDSRVYRYRRNAIDDSASKEEPGGRLEQLTTDDTLWAQLLRTGRSFADVKQVHDEHPKVIVKAIGLQPHIEIQTNYTRLEEGDLFVLCTDGVTAQLEDRAIREIVSDSRRSLSTRCRHLLDAADAVSGADNATAILVQC